MTREFDHVRAAYRDSIAGRLLIASGDVIGRAWRSSTTRSLNNTLAIPPVHLARATFTAIAVAALMQPLLIMLMPRTVAPALPWWGFASIGLLAAVIAGNAPAIVVAWPASRLRNLIAR